MKHALGCWAVVLAVMAAGCGSDVGSAAEDREPDGQRQEDNIQLEPKWRGTLEVSPGEAAPGQPVALTYPPGHRDVRGVAFSLSAWTADGWKVTHYLTSDALPGTKPSWWGVEDSEGRGWNDVGISGAGPDHVIVPGSATQGTHLLCTANAHREKCTLIQIRTD